MTIGVPKEIKAYENRVALTPEAAAALVRQGHRVVVEASAGTASGFDDAAYASAGCQVAETADEVFARADLVLKVKEPQPNEYRLMRPGQVLFTYLHLAADRRLTEALLEHEVTAIAYETVRTPDGALPLLAPMSEIAGRMAPQVGAHFLEHPQGGRGVLLGGVPGVAPAEVVILGAGTVGTQAARVAVGLGARVTLVDVNPAKLRAADAFFRGAVVTLISTPEAIARAVEQADLLIGAVLVPGARAPRLVSEPMVRRMKRGAVIVDVAVDQGGCIETVDRATTHDHPTYIRHGVVHYAVANMPGAVPRTATLALTNATLPFVARLAGLGFTRAVEEDPSLAAGVSTYAGRLTDPAVAEAHGFAYTPLSALLRKRRATGLRTQADAEPDR